MRMSLEKECHSFQKTFGTRSPKPYIRANWDSNLRRSNTNVPSNRGPPCQEPYNRDQQRVNLHKFPEKRREEEGTDEFHDALTKTPVEDSADPRNNPIMARIKDQASPVTGSLRHLLANTHTTAKSVEQPSDKRIMVINGKTLHQNQHTVLGTVLAKQPRKPTVTT